MPMPLYEAKAELAGDDIVELLGAARRILSALPAGRQDLLYEPHRTKSAL
ncbi:hypothetical protein [Streptomyces luteolifulvus]|nr:hypothetical protein [Streptomyces luteolifulvus]